MEKRNFLRFGKRTFEELVEPSATSAFAKGNGMHRRDYREFVRFGKRSGNADHPLDDDSIPMITEIDEAWIPLAAKYQQKRRDDFLRFGKRSNDFLRFG